MPAKKMKMGREQRVRLTATGPNSNGTDLTLRLSQLEINVPLDAAVFEVDVPAALPGSAAGVCGCGLADLFLAFALESSVPLRPFPRPHRRRRLDPVAAREGGRR